MKRPFVLCGLVLLCLAVAASGEVVWLDQLNMRHSICGWSQTRSRKSVGGNALRLRGKTYDRGVGTHPPGQFSVELAGGSKRFTATVGIDDETNGAGSAEFKVLADGKCIFDSGILRGRDPAKKLDVDVTGVQRLDLVVTVAGDGFGHDHTNWCDARFEVTGARPKSIVPPPPPRPSEFEVIHRQIRKGKGYWQRAAPQTFHPASLIHETDRDPTDVILRRTAVLLEHIRAMNDAPALSDEADRLAKLQLDAKMTDPKDAAARRKLFDRLATLRRRIAFANPLLSFDKILFIKKQYFPPSEGQGNHMCDQYFGFHAIREGGLFVLANAFGDKPTVRNVLADSVCANGRFRGRKLDNGGFLSPDLSYDGKEVLFAYTEAEPTRYRWSERSTYHVFRVNVDGTGLRQLTDGAVNDFDPTWMPNGRVVFISERRGGFGRCHGRPVPSFTLHDMLPDGGDIRCLSPHETNEWHPSIDSDGMIVYTRWDYVDRGFNQAHHPWITTPDGRDSRALHGNFARTQGGRPHMEMDCRAIPGSRKYMATAAGHHGQAYGSLVVIDPGIEMDNLMSTTKRWTPEVRFPESEGGRRRYATAWPLSEYFALCVYDPDGYAQRGTSNRFAICLVDAFGNKEEIHREAGISCLSPIPLRPRPRPPVVARLAEPIAPPAWTSPSRLRERNEKREPAKVVPGKTGPVRPTQTAPVAVLDVYDTEDTWPEGTRIAALRIIELLPKTTPHANGPRIGYGDQKGARAVLGTVPVESDGSAHFSLPVRTAVYFQALDPNGLAIQSMRSATYVHPEQRLLCQGCHEPRTRSPRQRRTTKLQALRRAPSVIRPDVDGSRPFSYPRLVQPVLDKNCVACHKTNAKAPDLGAGDVQRNGGQWYPSYRNLQKHAFYFNNAVWTAPRTIPGKFGARVSKLYRMLTEGSHKARVKLGRDDLHRITLWLDCNSDFFGSYDNTRDQARGKVVQPELE